MARMATTGETITEHVRRGAPVLADGAVETRVMFRSDVRMDPDVQVAAMVGDPVGGPALRDVFAGYVSVARSHALPVVVGTPTFRASARYVQRAGLGVDGVERLNRAAVEFQRDVVRDAGDVRAWVAGVLGPAGDAYTPSEALDVDAARAYHAGQADVLARAGVDFLFAATFPSVGEATGAALAMRDTDVPAVVSFVLGADGRVLDGTDLASAVARVDDVCAPDWFSLSCIHPTLAARALHDAGAAVERVREVKANGAALTPEQLVALDHPVADPPGEWAAAMWSLRAEFGIPVLGGCCGTDDRHVDALAHLMASRA
jgi:homocysteine S-methyltransferase